MGIRLIITVEALLRANCMLVQKIEHHEGSAPDDAQQFEPWDEQLLKVTFPNGREHHFDFVIADDKMWVECDYNNWGTAKQILEPILAEYDITHIAH